MVEPTGLMFRYFGCAAGKGANAANKVEIPVSGAILLRLSGVSPTGDTHSAAVMTYISPSSKSFCLSEQALIQLNVIPKTFPRLGGALQQSAINGIGPCDCPKRTKAQARPEHLPFECIPENNEKNKQKRRQRRKGIKQTMQ